MKPAKPHATVELTCPALPILPPKLSKRSERGEHSERR